ncbi:hypothetical protein Bhyg_06605 [Pseudolycoriella hygida]|uniref:Uncharacterized protein n=1 Tax=Pseudolycoriella hygida TaxID=35572 RepID=A0A9Q0S301_9DIPT|nr:hypothetical protein Bhyg_06605 [Pseudolycoriella hygida]
MRPDPHCHPKSGVLLG